MIPAPLRHDEPEALAALHALQVLDTEREADFQAIVDVASTVCDMPIALISLIDAERQWVLANTGHQRLPETPRDESFCAHTVLGDDILEITDTAVDERFHDNPLVTGEMGVRFYAGMPVETTAGHRLGAVCVVDRKPRTLDATQRTVLRLLAVVAGRSLEGRAATRTLAGQAQALADKNRALREAADALNEAQRIGHIGSWKCNVVDGTTTWSAEMYRITGRPPDSPAPPFSERLLAFAPELRPEIAAAFENCWRYDVPYVYEAEFTRIDGQKRWLDSRGVAMRDASGAIVGVSGTAHDITERKATERALRSSQELLERTGALAGVGGWEADPVTQHVVWSPELCRIHGTWVGFRPTFEEAIAFYAPSSRPAIELAVARALEHGEKFDLELEIVRTDGEWRHVHVVGSVDMVDGVAIRLSGACQDITERRRLNRLLDDQHELLRVTLRSIGEAVITTDADGAITWLNPVAERMTGWPNTEARDRPLGEVFRIVHQDTRAPAPDPVAVCVEHGAPIGPAQRSLLLSRDGSERGIEETAAPIRSESGDLLGVVLVFHDVSEQRRLSSEMTYRATHDQLTGLVNRAEFENRLQRTLEAAHETASEHALLYIDLDQFKAVNDTCGHAMGDKLLQQVARLLQDTVRSGDTLARLGGDEFAVVLGHCSTVQARRVAQNICDRMDEYRFVHEDRRFRIGASIGLVPVDDRWRDTDALKQAADASCYAAKEGGRNRYHEWFDTDDTLRTRHGEMQWTTRLERALDNDEFELFAQRLQPLQDPCAGLQAEVLLRLRDTDGTLIPPAAFLPAAERFHLVTRIDRWVVSRTLAWLRRLPSHQAIDCLCVNLSGQSVGDRAFHTWIHAQLAEAGDAIRRKLCLEITETAAVTHMADAALFVERVRAEGVRVALDDFGAGASSFGYLKHLQVDTIKIDGQFVRDVVTDPLDEVAVRSFVDVAKVVGVRTVAKLVEQPDVLARLQAMGVDYAQGFLVHRPAPLAELMQPVAAG